MILYMEVVTMRFLKGLLKIGVIIFCLGALFIFINVVVIPYQSKSPDTRVAYCLSDIGQINDYPDIFKSQEYDIVWKGYYNYYGYKNKTGLIYKLTECTEKFPDSYFMFKGERINVSHNYNKDGYVLNFEGDDVNYKINCLNAKKYYKSDIYDNRSVEVDNFVYSVLTVSKSIYSAYYKNTFSEMTQSEVGRDLLIKINPIEKTDSIVFDTKNNKTRIVGFRYPNIYLLHNDNVYKIPIKDITNTSKVVFSNYKILAHLSENHKYGNDYHYYLFDWEDDDLYIVYCPEADDNFIVTHIKTDN